MNPRIVVTILAASPPLLLGCDGLVAFHTAPSDTQTRDSSESGPDDATMTMDGVGSDNTADSTVGDSMASAQDSNADVGIDGGFQLVCFGRSDISR